MTNPPLVRSLCLVLPLLLAMPTSAADPTVTNVRAAQKTGTKQVEIYYDLSGSTSPVFVWLQVSSNGGANFSVPANTLSGEVGADVSLGKNKKITWNAGTDWNNQISNTMKFRVTARQTPPPGTYYDATEDLSTITSGNPHIDISSVDVTLGTAGKNLTFKINLAGNPVTTNWGKYMIAIRSGTGGSTTGNAWGRPINFAQGMTHWIGCWVDGWLPQGGAQVWSYSVSSWSEIKATYDAVNPLPLPVIDTSSVSITVPVSLLNVTPGQTFTFDVYTSGGGSLDGAVDALSAAIFSISWWGDPYTTQLPSANTNASLKFTMPQP